MEKRLEEIEKRWNSKNPIPTWTIGKDFENLLSEVHRLREAIEKHKENTDNNIFIRRWWDTELYKALEDK